MYFHDELFLHSLECYFDINFPCCFATRGNKHQNNPLVSTETVRHESTHIILYLLEKSDLDLMGPYCIKDLIE